MKFCDLYSFMVDEVKKCKTPEEFKELMDNTVNISMWIPVAGKVNENTEAIDIVNDNENFEIIGVGYGDTGDVTILAGNGNIVNITNKK